MFNLALTWFAIIIVFFIIASTCPLPFQVCSNLLKIMPVLKLKHCIFRIRGYHNKSLGFGHSALLLLHWLQGDHGGSQ